ncbi:hypothetical protein E2C01_052695 [Portunus trituberculatus]|uniref:Uncharacterized protein n=1 Tax=Portunus trituberculatus TaxID=210409 RepID=A0A5B7GNY2_PORTR|nr:hypothetical protein [Portunus trituberculatus]
MNVQYVTRPVGLRGVGRQTSLPPASVARHMSNRIRCWNNLGVELAGKELAGSAHYQHIPTLTSPWPGEHKDVA